MAWQQMSEPALKVAILLAVSFLVVTLYHLHHLVVVKSHDEDAHRTHSKHKPETKHCVIYNVDKVLDNKGFQCSTMETGLGSVPFCGTPPARDDSLKAFETLLQMDKSLEFIDIGSGVGEYTLTALKYGRIVIAVDSDEEDLRRLQEAIRLGKFQSKATLLLNAIDEDYTRVKVTLNDVAMARSGVARVSKMRSKSVSTIMMDDLLEVAHLKKALLRINMQSYECKAFKHATSFFDQIDIREIFIEWTLCKDTPGSTFIRNFLEGRGYSAFDAVLKGKKLQGDTSSWPNRVYWRNH